MSLAISDPSGGHRSAGRLLLENGPAGSSPGAIIRARSVRHCATGDRLTSSQPVAPLVIDA